MSRTLNKQMVIVLLVVGVVLLAFAVSRLHPRHSERAEVLQHPGVQWLSWSGAERDNYILGYMDGYGVGAADACLTADSLFDLDKPRVFGHDDVPGTFPSRRCLESVPKHANVKISLSTGPDFSAYTTPITEFYMKHPDQRDTSVLMLLEMLKGADKVSGDDLYSRLTTEKTPRR